MPLPPPALMRRVGHGDTASDEQVAIEYDRVGADIRAVVLGALPDDWVSPDRRILDFGAGAGRALRHLAPEAAAGVELWGCDIDVPSIAWAQRHLPWFTFIQNGEAPPLAAPDEHFDLVYAMSVFTHLTDWWADWLIELHRVLKPGGLLISTFLGRSMHERLLGDPFDERKVGMMVTRPGASWDAGGPIVFHSRWWLEAHWSPAFDLLRIDDDALLHGTDTAGHGLVVGRRAAGRPDRDAMLAPVAGEPREATAALENVRRLSGELEWLRRAGAGA